MVDPKILRNDNALLHQLETTLRSRFEPHFRSVELNRGDVLQDEGEIVQWVYFPIRGLIGLLSETPAGDAVESAMIGSDGALGAFEVCGSRKSLARATVQIPGNAWRIAAENYRNMYGASDTLRIVIHKYVEVLLAEARQYVACNAVHAVESRLCRSILDALYRSGATDRLPLTQETLARMLGVQRTTVALAISNLQRAGLVRSGRGAIEILDADGLESMSCDCHAMLRSARSEIFSSRETVCDAR